MLRSWVRIPSVLNVTNFVDDEDDGGAELFKYVDLGMRDKLRTIERPTVNGEDRNFVVECRNEYEKCDSSH